MLYSLIVSAVYGLLFAAWPEAANAAVVLFVALLVVPACVLEWRKIRRKDPGA
jgi:hypothetical protein